MKFAPLLVVLAGTSASKFVSSSKGAALQDCLDSSAELDDLTSSSQNVGFDQNSITNCYLYWSNSFDAFEEAHDPADLWEPELAQSTRDEAAIYHYRFFNEGYNA